MNTPSKSNVGGTINVGISSCLMGAKVRFDAGHKQSRYITDVLGEYFRFIPICPELEVGMGVPREAVRLIGDIDHPQMVGNRTGADWTDRMNRYARERVRRDDLSNLHGFILKKNSPSCGMERVKVYLKPGTVEKKGIGLFARAVLDQFPDLPVEEEGRLNDHPLRENFIVRVFAYHRLQELFAQPFSRRRVVEFHTAHKYLMLAHNPQYYRQMGQMVAAIDKETPAAFRDKYRQSMMQGLKYLSTVKKNVNVLQHIAGFMKKQATEMEKKDMHQAIADYHKELTPLVVPLTLIRHFINKYEVSYIQDQIYLNPHPKELMLRNHV